MHLLHQSGEVGRRVDLTDRLVKRGQGCSQSCDGLSLRAAS
jgi:hypothetical protein